MFLTPLLWSQGKTDYLSGGVYGQGGCILPTSWHSEVREEERHLTRESAQ